MSKISYCSLEEAWGDSFNRKDINNNEKQTTTNQYPEKQNNNKLYERNKYDNLINNSELIRYSQSEYT